MHLQITRVVPLPTDVNIMYVEYNMNNVLYFNTFTKSEFQRMNNLDLVNKHHEKALKC